MRRTVACIPVAVIVGLLVGCGNDSAPMVSAMEQEKLPANGELILASAVCPESLVKTPQQRKSRQESRTALAALEKAVRAHPDSLVNVERHNSDEEPHTFYETMTVLDLAKEQRDEAVSSAEDFGGQSSTWARCRQQLASRLEGLVNAAN
jgi:hypothetical protein